MYIRHFRPLNVQVHSEVFRCISDFPMFNNLVPRRRLVVERNGPKVGRDVDGKCLLHTGTFDRRVVKAFIIIHVIPIFTIILNNLVSRKTAGRRVKRINIWVLGVLTWCT